MSGGPMFEDERHDGSAILLATLRRQGARPFHNFFNGSPNLTAPLHRQHMARSLETGQFHPITSAACRSALVANTPSMSGASRNRGEKRLARALTIAVSRERGIEILRRCRRVWRKLWWVGEFGSVFEIRVVWPGKCQR